MSVKLLIEHRLEFLSLKGGSTGSFESTHVKTPHCLKPHVTAQFSYSVDPKICEPRCKYGFRARVGQSHYIWIITSHGYN